MELIESFYMWFAVFLRAGMTAASVFLAFSVLVAGIGFITTRNVGAMIVKAGGMMAFYSFLGLMVFTIPFEVMQLTNDMLHATQPIISDSVNTAVDTVKGDSSNVFEFGKGGVIYLTPEPVATTPPIVIIKTEPEAEATTLPPVSITPLPFPTNNGGE